MNYGFKYILIGCYVGVAFLGAVVYWHSKIAVSTPNSQTIVDEIHPVYAANFSDDRVLMGGSHDVFVGKVLEQVGTQDKGIGPETQFSVEVVENIKGNLQGAVIVDQQGGYENGVLTLFEDDRSSTDGSGASDYLLKPGFTYLLATRYSSTYNWYTLNPFPAARKLISQNSALSNNQLQALAESDVRVQQLQAAYPHEILLAADVAHNMTLNSYISTHPILPPSPPPPSAPSSTEEINPPVISGLTATAASSSATISWMTNVVATTQLLFGSSTAMVADIPVDTTLTTTHSQHISRLVPSTTYYYEAQSKDASNNTGSSAQQSFTTLGQ